VRRTARLIAEEIQRYCVAHPDARDTIEGIAWWVQMQRQEDLKNDVCDAVKVLVKRGVLTPHTLRDGSEVFGCGGSARLTQPRVRS